MRRTSPTKTSRSPDDGVGDEVVDEATADEACVHPTVARKKVLKRNATWNTNEPLSDNGHKRISPWTSMTFYKKWKKNETRAVATTVTSVIAAPVSRSISEIQRVW
mgnify:CR=1 FL=1